MTTGCFLEGVVNNEDVVFSGKNDTFDAVDRVVCFDADADAEE